MSRRFADLIQLTIERFETESDFLLLSEALTIAQIQDQLKQKNVDITQYNPKHYLFLLSLLNSDLNLDVYNHITTNIKDQGLLNRILGSTVDKRSNTPTVDVDAINRIAHNINNIEEIKRILNSVNQNRQAAAPVASQEDKEKAIEDFSTRIQKEVERTLAEKYRYYEVRNIVYFIYELIQDQQKLLPTDRLVQNYSYALPLASYFYNLPPGGGHVDKLEKLLSDLFPKYMADEDIRAKKVIFNEPYKTNFYQFSNYLFKYFKDKKFKNKKDFMQDWIFKNEDVTVYAGTVEDTFESIQRCIKYGKGVNPKYGLCISGSNAAYHYTQYRFHRTELKNLTTYFVYFNKQEDISKYDSEYFVFEALNDEHTGKLKYQFNKGAGNPGEFTVTPEQIIEKYPMIKEPLEKGVFKILPVNEEEKENYTRIKNTTLPKITNAYDLLDWMEAVRPNLDTTDLYDIKERFPEVFDYVFNTYIKHKIDFAEDELSERDFAGSGKSLKAYIFSSIKSFLEKNPEYDEKVNKYKSTLISKEIYIISNGEDMNSSYLERFNRDNPESTQKLIDTYISNRKNKWRPTNSSLYNFVFGKILPFFEKYPEFEEKYSDILNNYKLEEVEIIIDKGLDVTSNYFEKLSETHPDLIDDLFDRYYKKRIEDYFIGDSKRGSINDYIRNIRSFINSKPQYKEKYKLSPEIKEKEAQTIINRDDRVSPNYFEDLRKFYPDLFLKTLDLYIQNRANNIINKNEIDFASYTIPNAMVYLYDNLYEYINEDDDLNLRDRYYNLEKKLLLKIAKQKGNSYRFVHKDTIDEIEVKYPDILEEFLTIFVENKINKISNVSYNSTTNQYFNSDGDLIDKDVIDSYYLDDDVLKQITAYTSKINVSDKLNLLIDKLAVTFDINNFILNSKPFNSASLLQLQKTISNENEFETLLDRYINSRVNGFESFLKTFNNNYYHSKNIPPRGDLEEEIFFPLREFFYKNPKLDKKYEQLRKQLKIRAFDICGLREDTFLNSEDDSLNYNDKYLTSGWLEDVKKRFPDILEKGLDSYLTQKLNQKNIERLFNYNNYDRGYVTVNIESEVFKRIHDFELENKSLFEKYTPLRLQCIDNFIDHMVFDQVLNSAYFFRLDDTFDSDTTSNIFKKYIKNKLDYIEYIENKKNNLDEPNDDYVEYERNPYSRVEDNDLYAYIFEPLDDFLQTHPYLLNDDITESSKKLKYKFLVSYLTSPNEEKEGNKKKALQYIRYLNNNNEDNTELYKRIINEINSEESGSKSTKILQAYELFYTKIDDKETLKKIFALEGNKNKLLNLMKMNDGKALLNASSTSDDVIYWHQLILFKLKIDRLKNANSNSFLRMINDIIPNTGHVILEDLFDFLKSNKKNKIEFDKENKSFKTYENGTEIRFNNLINVFFSSEKIFNYINQDKKLKNDLHECINKSSIMNINLNNVIHTTKEISRCLNFILQFSDYKDNPIYLETVRHDETMNNSYKNMTAKLNGNNIIKKGELNITYFHQPPDLSDVTMISDYREYVNISVHSYFPIKSLKFLPSSFLKENGRLTIRNSILENNIDHLPRHTTDLVLDNVTFSSEKDFISNNVNLYSIKELIIANAKKLTNLKGINSSMINKLSLNNCKDLISLKGCPMSVKEFKIDSCNNIRTLKNSPLEANKVYIWNMQNLANFVGIPRSKNYNFMYTRINSFKGLPKVIDELELTDIIDNKNLARKNYSYFPNSINRMSVYSYSMESNKDTKNFKRYLFSKIKNVFPSYIGNIEQLLPNKATDPFESKIYNIYTKNAWKNVDNDDKHKNTLERLIKQRTPTKQDELEAIEKKQDKAAEREKKKRLKKEDVDITPFNVLLEDIVNTIKTSFKVYK